MWSVLHDVRYLACISKRIWVEACRHQFLPDCLFAGIRSWLFLSNTLNISIDICIGDKTIFLVYGLCNLTTIDNHVEIETSQIVVRVIEQIYRSHIRTNPIFSCPMLEFVSKKALVIFGILLVFLFDDRSIQVVTGDGGVPSYVSFTSSLLLKNGVKLDPKATMHKLFVTWETASYGLIHARHIEVKIVCVIVYVLCCFTLQVSGPFYLFHYIINQATCYDQNKENWTNATE